jgi:hypothetical protein
MGLVKEKMLDERASRRGTETMPLLALQGLERDKAIDAMREWFETYLCNPVHKMLRVDKDYIYPYGGPRGRPALD